MAGGQGMGDCLILLFYSATAVVLSVGLDWHGDDYDCILCYIVISCICLAGRSG